jgi:phenylacetate-CoA ligase
MNLKFKKALVLAPHTDDGEFGYVVVTHLDAYEMPLIKYYLGDLAIKMPKDEYPPQKELDFPLFKKMIGRDTDMVVTHLAANI